MNINIAAKSEITAHQTSANILEIEFELALGAEDIRANGFEACVENAATKVGFSPLFNLPLLIGNDIQRLAALAGTEGDEVVFVFVGLHKDGSRACLNPDLSELPHLEKFAETYFDLLNG